MKSKWIAHLSSTLVVVVLLSLLIVYFNQQPIHARAQTHTWIKPGDVDVNNPEERAILEEALNLFEPGKPDAHAALISNLQKQAESKLIGKVSQRGDRQPFDMQVFRELRGSFLQFSLIFLMTLLISWYGALTLGSLKFIWRKQGHASFLMDGVTYIKKHYRPLRSIKAAQKNYKRGLLWIGLGLGKAVGYILLFSPAYVLAYSFRTRFASDMSLMMVVLGVVSNGALIIYTYKFYLFLKAEAQKGYVETAIVKNMHHAYDFNKRDGIYIKNLLHWTKKFPDHVFGAIYKNALMQFLPTLKEQASFLISGLIIIEMALNIQGHLSYELLQQILYKNYGIATAIVLGIFLLVKITEVFVDILIGLTEKKYSNR